MRVPQRRDDRSSSAGLPDLPPRPRRLAMRRMLARVHWHWLPLAILSGIMVWTEDGAPIAILALLGGLALGFYVERRARKRRERGRAP